MSHSEKALDKMEQEFLDNHSSNNSLSKAVIEQMGGMETFHENAPQIASHGVDGGYAGFIYNSDTEAFTEKNYGTIVNALKEDAAEFGHESISEMMTNWRSLNDLNQDQIAEAVYGQDSENENHTQVYNAMAWYAAEKVSYEFSNALEDLKRSVEPQKEFDTIGEVLSSEHAENLHPNQVDMLKQIEEYLDSKGVEIGAIEVNDVALNGNAPQIEVEITATNYQLDAVGEYKEDISIFLTTENNGQRDVVYVGNSDEAKPFTIEGQGVDSGIGSFEDMRSKLSEHLLDKIEISTLEHNNNQITTVSYHDNDHSAAIDSLNKAPDGTERLLKINGEPIALNIHDAANPKETNFIVINEESSVGKTIGENWNKENNAVVSTPQEQGGWKTELIKDEAKQEKGKDSGMEME